MSIPVNIDSYTAQLVTIVLYEILIHARHGSRTVWIDPNTLARKSPLLTEAVMVNIFNHHLRCLIGQNGVTAYCLPSDPCGDESDPQTQTTMNLYVLDADIDAAKEQYDELVGEFAADRVQEHHRKTRPTCFVKDGLGTLFFPDTQVETLIGRASSNPFRLLEFLLPHPETMFASGAVFHAMTDGLSRYITDARYASPSRQRTFMSERVRFAIKELQKEHKLQGRIRFVWSDDGRSLGIEVSR